jgi:integrase
MEPQMPRQPRIPSLNLHKFSGRAVVRLSGRDYYCGRFGSPEAQAEYERILALWLANDRKPLEAEGAPTPAPITVDEVLARFWEHAERHYRRADGTLTNEIVEYRDTFRVVRPLFSRIPAAEFGPLALKAVREQMHKKGWCRNVINNRIGRVKRVFKWAASEQLIPGSVHLDLMTVTGWQANRTEARESEPIRLVPRADVEATLPHLNRQIRGLVQFQLLTGCRPGEACALRRCELDTSRDVWVFRPRQHKTAHRGDERTIVVGPRCQELLANYPTEQDTDFVFSPRRAVAELHEARAANRRTPRYPSHLAYNAKRAAERSGKAHAEGYTTTAYQRAVRRAAEKAQVTHWHPNQLRHLFATEVRLSHHGLEAAQVLLGHARCDVTQVYAERNLKAAAEAIRQLG